MSQFHDMPSYEGAFPPSYEFKYYFDNRSYHIQNYSQVLQEFLANDDIDSFRDICQQGKFWSSFYDDEFFSVIPIALKCGKMEFVDALHDYMMRETQDFSRSWGMYAKYMITYKRIDLLIDLYNRCQTAKNCILQAALEFNDFETFKLFFEKPGTFTVSQFTAFWAFTRETNECLKYLIEKKVFPVNSIQITIFYVNTSENRNTQKFYEKMSKLKEMCGSWDFDSDYLSIYSILEMSRFEDLDELVNLVKRTYS
jgi:hypothetical protein